MMRITLVAFASAALLLAPAHAQAPFGLDGSVGGAHSVSTLTAWIMQRQQEFFVALRTSLVALRTDPAALWWLTWLSFAYGVFHAAGPGHGKAVISSYILATGVELRRGIALAFLSALVQAFAALVLVCGAWWVLRGSGITMSSASHGLEVASYGLLAGFGCWLLIRKLAMFRAYSWTRPLFRIRSGATDHLAFSASSVGRAADRRLPTSIRFTQVPSAPALARQARHLDHHNGCNCGQSHIAHPQALSDSTFGFRSGAAAVLTVGLRPCSGAVVVLSFSLVNGLYAGGALSVLAMAIGTAITVSVIATLTVLGKETVARFAGARATATQTALEIGGALLLTGLGIGLLLERLGS